MNYPESFEELLESFKMLPGIGNKSAERLVYHVLSMKNEDVLKLSTALTNFKSHIHYCKHCGNIAEDDLCEICQDDSRDTSQICIVESPKDVYAMEKLKEYKGLYHVIGGTVSIIDGITLDDLNIHSLMTRLDGVKEIIIATNPTREGETTALLIAKLLEDKDITITRIANGLPMGGSLDYADELTLLRSFEGRQKM